MSHLLELEDLKVFFDTSSGIARAVDGVSYSIDSGRTLGVVGESGCGKTVSALSILRLTPKPGRIAGGKIIFEGDDLLGLSENEMRKIRGNRIAMIFQEPMTSLNPVFTIGNQISEGVRLHRGADRKEAWERSIEMLKKVGIPSPEKRVSDYPHQLSGGMRQRAMIAMALSCDPTLLIADEPTTALDVTIQSQILDLMTEMREQYSASIILITHDLSVVAQTCDDVVVMYAGKVVESAPVKTLFSDPSHPYTRGLLESIPSRHVKGEGKKRLKEIKGVVPALTDLPAGCPFNPRCPDVMDVCRIDKPELKAIKSGASAACWLYGSGVASRAP
ncbi:Oligopeptide transport ATP-binding protein OppD (TC 3.A.1.5.1) [hydrothermal vent metagenome]|uniref:Oligopeptide transport ATP-binding protein OppD (TC 3.A.1.5.1) n=1 Tax=hydrothermal vent metagenome TaxID=652676 RepID=A0A3B1BU20_9ZZZZ